MELRIDRQAMVPVVQQIVDGMTDWIVQSGIPPAPGCPPYGKSPGVICSASRVSSKPASAWFRKVC